MTNGGWPGHVIKDMRTVCKGADIKCEMQIQFDFEGGNNLVTSMEQIEQWIQNVKKHSPLRDSKAVDEEGRIITMAKLAAFYSRADENYFGGSMKYIEVGNTEKAAKMIAELTGADLFKIEQTVPYAADYNTCIAQAKKDKQENARPEVVSPARNRTSERVQRVQLWKKVLQCWEVV